MPIDINLVLHRKHRVVKNAGYTTANPALETAGRLYVIRNDLTSRQVYVGTAADVQGRFGPRVATLREWGFNNATLGAIKIYVYRVLINGVARQPNNLGLAGGVDVEHLLIRLHLNQNVNVRNIAKIAAFNNTSGQVMNLTLSSSPALNVPGYLGGVVIHQAIANHAAY